MDIRLADSELEVMRILWREKRPLKVSEFRDELEQRRGWNKSTTQTVVTRMRDKGFIEPLDRYGVARYVPLISEDEYTLAEGKAVLERFGSAKTLAMAMVRNGSLSDSDIEELRDYFKMGGDGK
ncbi:MAG: BlaI/MecI/CopY family transcriptional regulator [Oscillospiraceae bacterium]|nr:BlaI/MecI/CopY family transcriptional regulator [Oscillospiraceae bacterium]